MADKLPEDEQGADRAGPISSTSSRTDGGETSARAHLVAVEVDPVADEGGKVTGSSLRRTRTASDRAERIIRSTPPVYRWVCPCQEPPVLLATYGPNARINIKVRDRYWHLQGFGMVEAICPRCAAEHMLDMRMLRSALEDADSGTPERTQSSG